MDFASSKSDKLAQATVRRPVRRYGILVVDDDEGVRAVLSIWLRHQGYTVWLADSGQEAVDLYANHRDTIDVVLLDVRMPVMDGPQTLAALLKIDPLVCCCFMSGERGAYSDRKLREMGGALVLGKPFRLSDVARLLWELAAPLGSESATPSNNSVLETGAFTARRRVREECQSARSA